MISLKQVLEAKTIPADLSLSHDDLLTLVKMHKGLLKENERNKAFWLSTNKNLENVTEELGRTNQELRKLRDQLWGEMQLAKKIQTVLLPKKTIIDGYEVTAYMNPADEVGGDYYDIINTDGRDWVVIGDVSGHGVSAGLVMMMVQTSIRVALSQHNDLPPSELLILINRAISDNIRKMEEDKYMTITVMAVFEEGRFHFSGLHQDIMIHRHSTHQVERVDSEGMWLGIVDDISDMVEDRYLTLGLNDTMLLFTDGITEAWKTGIETKHRKQRDMFGEDRLIGVLQKWGDSSPTEIRDRIIEELVDFHCKDDVTMVVIKRVR